MSETLNLISGLNQLEPRAYNLAAVVQIPAGAQIVGTPGKTILNNPTAFGACASLLQSTLQ